MFRVFSVIHSATIEVSIPIAANDTSASEVIEPLSAQTCCYAIELARPIFRPIYELKTNIQNSSFHPSHSSPYSFSLAPAVPLTAMPAIHVVV